MRRASFITNLLTVAALLLTSIAPTLAQSAPVPQRRGSIERNVPQQPYSAGEDAAKAPTHLFVRRTVPAPAISADPTGVSSSKLLVFEGPLEVGAEPSPLSVWEGDGGSGFGNALIHGGMRGYLEQTLFAPFRQKGGLANLINSCAPKTPQYETSSYPLLAIGKACELWPNNFPTVTTCFLVGDDKVSYALMQENCAFYSPFGGMVTRFYVLPGVVNGYTPVGVVNGTYAWWFRHQPDPNAPASRWAVVRLDVAITAVTGSFGIAPAGPGQAGQCDTGAAGLQVMAAEYPILDGGGGCDGCVMYTSQPRVLSLGAQDGTLGLNFNPAALGGPVFRMVNGRAVAIGVLANQVGEDGCLTRFEALTPELVAAINDIIVNRR
jgi:hypothetical protein